jgi:agmatinase
MIFADSSPDYESSKYVIVGVLFDATSSFRTGSRWAPDAVRRASFNFETYDYEYDIDITEQEFHDAGNIEFGNVCDMISEVEVVISGTFDDGKVPLTLGGEHTITFPCVKALSKSADIGVVILDAHLDFRNEYLGNKYSHAGVAKYISDLGVPLVQIGTRSGTKEEYQLAAARSNIYAMDEIRKRGIAHVLNEIEGLLDVDSIYLSIDMDAIDPAFAPGVGNPEPYGLTPLEVRTALRTLSPVTSGFDIVEITPDYDMGMSALLGAKLLRDFIFASSQKKGI